MHKEGSTDCLLVSSINCHTAKISKYVNYHLQPILKKIASYVKDNNDFVNKINAVKSAPKNSYLITMGVRYYMQN